MELSGKHRKDMGKEINGAPRLHPFINKQKRVAITTVLVMRNVDEDVGEGLGNTGGTFMDRYWVSSQ